VSAESQRSFDINVAKMFEIISSLESYQIVKRIAREFSIKQSVESYLPKCRERDCREILLTMRANIEFALTTLTDMNVEFLLVTWNVSSFVPET
jgi:2-hydroxy-3-keto-5-methylthiopentenyl-1-phosphate phosphatase